MKIALVFDSPTTVDKPRAIEFARLFTVEGVTQYCVYNKGGDWAVLNSDGTLGDLLPADQRPIEIDCLLMHAGDYKKSISAVTKQVSNGWRIGFIFNGSGDPPSTRGFIRILRPTSTVPFGLTSKHRDEILELIKESIDGTGPTPPLPSCCYESAKHLIALDILAQGYLFAHGMMPETRPVLTGDDALWEKRRDLTESQTDWWLRGLALKSSGDLKGELLADHLAEANAADVVEQFTNWRVKTGNLSDEKHPLVVLRETIADLLQ
jgi:hypothetical protein